MHDIALARAIHVISIVFWIGGVGFVTAIVLPALKIHFQPSLQKSTFHFLESRFSLLAKILVLLAGLSGFYMMYRLNLWNRFNDPRFFWMHAMVLIWGIFMLALFIVEPLLQHRITELDDPSRITANLERIRTIHWVLLIASIATVFASVLGSHGFFY